jgi:hypothetical protein
MFDFNIFSKKTYITTDNVMFDQNGKSFIQSDDDWIMSLRSGARSEFADPFGDDDE